MTTAFPCKTARPCLFGWSWKMAVPSVVRDIKTVSSISTLVQDTSADDYFRWLRWTKCTSPSNLSNQHAQLMMMMMVVVLMDKRLLTIGDTIQRFKLTYTLYIYCFKLYKSLGWQPQFTPNNINTSLAEKVTRIRKWSRKGKCFNLLLKFS